MEKTRNFYKIVDDGLLFGSGLEVLDGYTEFDEKKPPEELTTILASIERRNQITSRLAAIDREYRTPRTIADAQVGDEEAVERLRTAYKLSKPLRAELDELGSPAEETTPDKEK